MEKFDALLRRAVIAVREDEQPVVVETVRVFVCALHGHTQALRDRAKSRMSVRRDFVEEEESRARPQIAEQLHRTTQIGCYRKSSGKHHYIVKSIEQTPSGFEEEARVRLMVLAALAIATLFLPSLISPATAVMGPPAAIRILFDFGDGTYRWTNATVEDPAAVNATWYAVQAAAASANLWISWYWYTGSFPGIFITDIGNRSPPTVGIFIWNWTANLWDGARVGIRDLVVKDGDVAALTDTAYDPVTYRSYPPAPTPLSTFPVTPFPGDLINSGSSASTPPNTPGVRWDRDTGAREIASTPAVAYGKVFVETMHGSLALDEVTGETVWTNVAAKGSSSPAIFDNSVIVGTSNGTVLRLNASDGAIQWETRLLAQTVFSGITSSPKAAFARVFIGTFNESGGAGEVVSLWARNGTVAWRHPTGSVHFSSPAVANDTVYVGIMGTYNTTSQVTFDPPFGVLALDATSGAERWFYPTAGSVAASPVIAGSRVIVPSKHGDVYAIDGASGMLDWKALVDSGISSPALSGSTVVVGGSSFGGSGRVWALEVATGSPKWSFAPNGPVQASITVAGGLLLFATNTANGTVYALNATTGRSVWRFEPSPAEYILGSPVVADGMVFVPSDNGHLYALAELPSTGPPPMLQPSLLFYLVVFGGPLAIIAVVAIVIAVLVRRRSRRGP